MRLALLLCLLLVLGSCDSGGAGPASGADDTQTATLGSTTTTETTGGGNVLPAACGEIEPPYPGAFDLPERSAVVAQFPFADGVVVLIRQDQPTVTSFEAIECFTGGGPGFSGGGPGETWQGGSRVDYSDAGYAIVIVEDPTWTVAVDGRPVELVVAGEVGAGMTAGTFTRPPHVAISDDR